MASFSLAFLLGSEEKKQETKTKGLKHKPICPGALIKVTLVKSPIDDVMPRCINCITEYMHAHQHSIKALHVFITCLKVEVLV